VTRIVRLGLLLAFLCGLAAAGQQLTPQNFAVGFPLELEGGYGAYRLELDERVYRAASRPQLTDLRVFDNEGAIQPHVLDLPRPPGGAAREIELPLFTLHCSRPDSSSPEELSVETGPDGTVIRIRGKRPAGPQRHVWGYLLDFGGLEGRPTRLVFGWEPVSESFVARITLEGSDDLVSWRPLTSSVLAELSAEGQRIVRNEIELPSDPPRYLRLAWPAKEGPKLQRVVAVVVERAAELPLRWNEPQPRMREGGMAWVYDAGGPFPVRRLVVTLPSGSGLARIRVESRPSGGAAWTTRYRGLAYNLELEDEPLVNEPVPLATTDRYWRVTIEKTWGTIAHAPGLRLGWRPHRLRFSAGGAPPYLLAVGSVTAGAVDPELERGFRALLDALPESAFGEARLGPQITLAGAAALTRPEPRRPLPWRTWILWGVLVLGVFAIAGMVRSLMREMASSDR